MRKKEKRVICHEVKRARSFERGNRNNGLGIKRTWKNETPPRVSFKIEKEEIPSCLEKRRRERKGGGSSEHWDRDKIKERRLLIFQTPKTTKRILNNDKDEGITRGWVRKGQGQGQTFRKEKETKDNWGKCDGHPRTQ